MEGDYSEEEGRKRGEMREIEGTQGNKVAEGR
jgi:hypothetical protein